MRKLSFRALTATHLVGIAVLFLTARISSAGVIDAGSIKRALNQTKLTAADEPGGGLGTAVAASGSRILVGAPYDNNVAGSAYIFVYNGTQWTEEAKLTAPDAAPGAGFGSAVSLSGSVALIGAPYYYGTAHPGEAYVYLRTGSTWTQTATLTASDGGNSNYFASSVAIRGKTALVGAPGNSHAYIFSAQGSTWTQQAILKPAGGLGFGPCVALGDNRAVVGGGTVDDGHAYYEVSSIYSYDGQNWVLEASITPPGNEGGDEFGDAVSLDGDQVLFGAPGVNFFGAGYIYTFNGTGWIYQQTLLATDQPDNSELGTSVALQGNRALLGAPGAGDDYTGSALLFTSNGTTWTQSRTITALDGMAMDFFGSSVALSSGHAVIGAPGATVTNPYDGAAYVFGRQ